MRFAPLPNTIRSLLRVSPSSQDLREHPADSKKSRKLTESIRKQTKATDKHTECVRMLPRAPETANSETNKYIMISACIPFFYVCFSNGCGQRQTQQGWRQEAEGQTRTFARVCCTHTTTKCNKTTEHTHTQTTHQDERCKPNTHRHACMNVYNLLVSFTFVMSPRQRV